MSIVIHKNFVDDSDRQDFLNHINDIRDKFVKNPVGPFRQSYRLDSTEDFTNLHHQYFLRIAKLLNLKEIRIDPFLGILYSIINPGGYIHLHIDKYPPYHTGEFINYRFNLMLNRDDDNSYNPIIKDTTYDVGIKDAWSFPASLLEHKTDIVVGNADRIVLQFGFQLTLQEYEAIIAKQKIKEFHEENSSYGPPRNWKNFFIRTARTDIS